MESDRLVLANDHMKIGGDHMKIGGDHIYAQLLILSDIAHSLRSIAAIADMYANGPRG